MSPTSVCSSYRVDENIKASYFQIIRSVADVGRQASKPNSLHFHTANKIALPQIKTLDLHWMKMDKPLGW